MYLATCIFPGVCVLQLNWLQDGQPYAPASWKNKLCGAVLKIKKYASYIYIQPQNFRHELNGYNQKFKMLKDFLIYSPEELHGHCCLQNPCLHSLSLDKQQEKVLHCDSLIHSCLRKNQKLNRVFRCLKTFIWLTNKTEFGAHSTNLCIYTVFALHMEKITY